MLVDVHGQVRLSQARATGHGLCAIAMTNHLPAAQFVSAAGSCIHH
jgi:hypothetical protein